MTDHCYWMSCLNENIGYNQPTHTGYYLGSDLKSDAEAWTEAEKVKNINIPTAVNAVITRTVYPANGIYNLSGQRVNATYKGIVIKNGEKVYNK